MDKWPCDDWELDGWELVEWELVEEEEVNQLDPAMTGQTTPTDHPAPPLRCLCETPRGQLWFYQIHTDGPWRSIGDHNYFFYSHELTAIPHPRNDPEAVEMIEAARKETK